MKLERLDDSSIQLREITLSCHIAILMEKVGVWTWWGWGGRVVGSWCRISL